MPQPVRLATSDDAADVARLLIAFRDWNGRDWPPDERFLENARRLLADEHTEYLLAGDPPAGVCQLRFRWSVWRDAWDCCLEDLFVSEEARGAGMGRALVEAALERARARGSRRIELDALEANTPAVELYRSLGFESGDAGSGGRHLFMTRWL